MNYDRYYHNLKFITIFSRVVGNMTKNVSFVSVTNERFCTILKFIILHGTYELRLKYLNVLPYNY